MLTRLPSPLLIKNAHNLASLGAVGGLGLNLVGADRAVLYDPSWNPTDDTQAIDRCYRIGQKKPVTVYRLISAGTVEESMYEKQIHKDGLRRSVLVEANTKRYFSSSDLKRLFTLLPAGGCNVIDNKPFSKTAEAEVQVEVEQTQLRVGGDFYSFLNKYDSSPMKGGGSAGRKEGGDNDDDARGASGKKSFLNSHECVVGVTYHDEAYKEDVGEKAGGGNSPATPFSSVTKGGYELPAESAVVELDFDDDDASDCSEVQVLPDAPAPSEGEILDEIKKVLAEGNVENLTVRVVMATLANKFGNSVAGKKAWVKQSLHRLVNEVNDEEEEMEEIEEIEIIDKENVNDNSNNNKINYERKAKKQLLTTQRKMARADELFEEGDDEGAIIELLDIVERNPSTLPKQMKLDVHRKIAVAVKDKGWLQN